MILVKIFGITKLKEIFENCLLGVKFAVLMFAECKLNKFFFYRSPLENEEVRKCLKYQTPKQRVRALFHQ